MKIKDILMLYAKSDIEQAEAIRNFLEANAKLAKAECENIKKYLLSIAEIGENEMISVEATRLYAFSERQLANTRKGPCDFYITRENYNEMFSILQKAELSFDQRSKIADLFINTLQSEKDKS